jgi:hypothetical protein
MIHETSSKTAIFGGAADRDLRHGPQRLLTNNYGRGTEVQAAAVAPKLAVPELQVQPAYHVSAASFTAPM